MIPATDTTRLYRCLDCGRWVKGWEQPWEVRQAELCRACLDHELAEAERGRTCDGEYKAHDRAVRALEARAIAADPGVGKW